LSVIRAFIAIDLSPEITSQLGKVADNLKRRLPELPIRWVPVENIHLTVKFLGDVSIASIDMLENILTKEARQHLPFEISAGELGAFPSTKRPRVIWIGVEYPQELNNFHHGLETETARLGYTRDKRSFSPHLTLGRISRGASPAAVRQIGDVICKCNVGFLGAARVDRIHLYRSDLKPDGAVYSKLFSATFVGNVKRSED